MRAKHVFAVLAALAGLNAAVAETAVSPRFQLNGSGRLSPDVPPQTGGTLRLMSTLQALQPRAAPAALTGGRYELRAVAAASNLVCYNDTIFRDDFDGDGF